jgi:predicted dehydrogenase
MKKRCRIGLAGAGWVTEHHLDAYGKLKGRAEVVAIADPRIEAATARAEQYGIPAIYHSVEAMLAQEELDALDIAAPREHHVPLCRLAARHGLAILCQKPLAPILPEAEALVAEVGDRTRLMVHENWRFRPHYRQTRAWIDAGRIGAVRSARMSLLTSGLLPDETGKLPALERQPMLAGLERMLLMEVMIHHVDTLRFLLGPLALREARLDKRCGQIRGEDRATLQLATADGVPVLLHGDFMVPGQPAAQRDRGEIVGSAGSIVLRDDELRLATTSPDETPAPLKEAQTSPDEIQETETPAATTVRVDLQADYKESYRAAIAHFLERLADGGPFETSARDNLQTLAIVEAAYQMGL